MNKPIISTFGLIPVLWILVTGLAGCVSPVVGKWRNVQRDANDIAKSQQLTMAFEPNGIITIPEAGHTRKTIGKYSIKGDMLSLESGGQTLAYRYEMTQRTLRLQSPEQRRRSLLFLREPLRR